MVIVTVQLPPDRVPYVNPSEMEACAELASELAMQFGESIKVQPEFRNIAKRFATGKHVVFVTFHTEEAMFAGPSRS